MSSNERDGIRGISKFTWRDGSVRWRARVQMEGRRVTVGVFESHEAAEAALSAALEQRSADETGTTLRAWGEAWHDRRERRVRGSAKERACWRAHVLPYPLATMPIAKIRRVHVASWLETLARRTPTISVQTIRHARRLVVGALEDAYDRGKVDRNHARGAPIPRREEDTEERWTWLTQEEIGRVLALPISDPSSPHGGRGGRKPGHLTSKQRAAFILAVYAGLRAGELWGLRWADVVLDDQRPELVIRHSRDGATKSGRVRRVPLLGVARDALVRWRELAPGVGSALVFPATSLLDGSTICHRDGYDAGWARIRVMAGLDQRRPVPRWHDLRHTCASHLAQGTWGRAWSLREIQQVLGHSSIRVTERYAHLCPGGIADAARETTAAMRSGQQVGNAPVLNIGAVRPSARNNS